jgi:hypothetical protein
LGIAIISGAAAYGAESGAGAVYDSRIEYMQRPRCDLGAGHDLCASTPPAGAV